MKNLLMLFFLLINSLSFAQVVTTTPLYPMETDSIVVFLDATKPGAEELLNYTGTVYAHTGVNTNLGNWRYVIGTWGNNQTQPALTRLGPNLYRLIIGRPRQFYGITNPAEKILTLNFVFRSAEANKQTRPDIFIRIYQPGVNLVIQNPAVEVKFGDPLRSPAFVKFGETVQIDVRAIVLQTQIQSIRLFVNGNQVAQSDSARLLFNFVHSNYPIGANNIRVIATPTSGVSDTSNFVMFCNPQIVNASLPANIKPGINYTSPVTATLALFAPYKDFIYVIGDFNDWKVQTSHFMKRQFVNPDSVIWWIELSNLTPAFEYAFQYLVDGKIRTGDPYSEKILDPWNDQYIPPQVYPNLKAYPTGKTESIVSVLQTAQTQYQWQVTNFQKPPKENLIIYELLVRDFSTQKSFQFLIDTLSYLKNLGVNAIELMPIMEFSGNLSWGYNPIYHLAVDKFYGPANKLKQFIDLCHQNGIAVILDQVLNHADYHSPLVMMWWDSQNNRPAANNPYFNQTPRHPFSVFYDFNHESNATKYFVDRVNEYWIKEFKFDGIRFDLSKGFTQNFTNDVNAWSQYDQSRINLLTRMANKIWQVDPTNYVILEHFAANNEEIVLSNAGMLLWGNLNYQYNEATMGYASDLSWGSYKARGWQHPHLITYMESHDEERLMYKNLQFGNSFGSYNIRNLRTALHRIQLAGAFLFTIPGPKMIWQFGELGYDVSIEFNGRTGEKPVRWNYYSEPDRLNLFKVFRELIKLKKTYPAFNTTNYTIDVGGYVKKINLMHPSMDIAVIGNFYVDNITPNANFSKTGWWYNHFTRDSLFVTNTGMPITLKPGEFHIFTTVRLPAPEPNIILNFSDYDENNVPESFKLEQNYPNPFSAGGSAASGGNPSTTISWQSPIGSWQTIKLYNSLGEEIDTIVEGYYEAGKHSKLYILHSTLPSGVYFYQLRAGDYIETKKMILIR
jgi:glycosidase